MRAYSDLECTVNFRGEGRNVSKYGAYSIALRRAECDIGAGASLRMATSGIDGGNLKDPSIVVRHEHLAAAAKRARSRIWHECRNDELALALGPDDEPSHDALLMCEVVLFSGDATTADVLDNKFYVSRTSTSSLLLADGQACANAAGELDAQALQYWCPSLRSACDLQVVETGTAEEVYSIFLRSLGSVGAPTWDLAALSNRGKRCRYNTGAHAQTCKGVYAGLRMLVRKQAHGVSSLLW